MRKNRNWLRLLTLVMLLVLIVGSITSSSETAATTSTNLLANPGFDDGIWDWFWPGHFVARGWWRWWIDGDFLPEWFPAETANRIHEGSRAQRWHGLVSPGQNWRAGLYQIVQVDPCATYELSAWSNMHVNPTSAGTLHHKVGLDPFGRQYTKSDSDAAVKDDSMRDIVYSAEQQNYYVYEQLSVQAEALNTQISAVLYSRNERFPGAPIVIPFDSHYDSTSLVQVPYEDNRLPAPDYWTSNDIIYNVNAVTGTNQITITWQTALPASTQVWYDYFVPAAPGSATEAMTYTLYAPYTQNGVNPADFAYESDYDTTPVTSHTVTIAGLPDDAIVLFTPLSRYLQNNTCTTTGYAAQKANLP